MWRATERDPYVAAEHQSATINYISALNHMNIATTEPNWI